MTLIKSVLRSPLYLLVLAYPPMVYFKLIETSLAPLLVMLLLTIFAVIIKFWRTAFFMLAILLIAFVMYERGQLHDLYFLPPIAINLFVGLIFFNSLRKAHTPLIEKYILLMEGKVDTRERNYARVITTAWVVVLFALMLESALLTLFFSHEVWSLFTNVINYLVLASMFVIEYFIRLRVFPDRQHMSFVEYISRLKNIKLKSVVM